jgi:transposase
MKAVLLYDKGWLPGKIAEALMIDESTVRRHMEEYEEKHKLKPENGGSTSKLDENQTADLVAYLEAQTYVHVKEVCAYVQSTYCISYGVFGMTFWLRGSRTRMN